MKIRAAEISDLGFILRLYNEAILHTTAVYEYEPFTEDYIHKWFKEKTLHDRPIILAEEAGIPLGFATYGEFRHRTAYRTTVEHSVYVVSESQGRGIGRALLSELISIARKNGVHVMVGGIDADNTGSIIFHEKAGFYKSGHVHQVAFKFDRWLDLVFMQKVL